jgi:thiol-disulfide isomerase/thioredoxin
MKLFLFLISPLLAFSQKMVNINQIGNHYLMKASDKSCYVLKTYLAKPNDYKLPLTSEKNSSFYYTILSDSSLGCDYIFNKFYVLLEKSNNKTCLYITNEKDDFTKAVKYEISKRKVLLEFNSKKNNAKIGIIFSQENFFENGFFGSNIKGYREAPKECFLNFTFTNIKYGHCSVNGVDFLLGVFDVDNDGSLDTGIDFIYTSIASNTYFFIGGVNKSTDKISNRNLIKVDSGNYIKVTKIDFNSNKIYYEDQLGEFQGDNYISVFTKMPKDLFYKNASNELIPFSKELNQDKFVFIDIWTSFCQPCIKGLPRLDSISQVYSDKVTIISLLDKDEDHSELLGLIEQYQIKHRVGWSSQKINYEFLLSGYPHGILFDPKGNVVDFISYKDLKKTIDDFNYNGKR